MLVRVSNLTALPESFAAGTTVKYTRTLTDFPAPTWQLKLYLAGAAAVNVTAAASGSDHLVTLATTDTAQLAPAGMFRWSERATKSGETYEVGTGSVYVTANIAAAAPGDLASMNEKLLAAIDAVIAGKITDDALQYSVAGRGLTLMSRSELYALRQKVARDVAVARRGGKSGRVRRITFTGASNES